jgi:iron complex outermembrane receptor protein
MLVALASAALGAPQGSTQDERPSGQSRPNVSTDESGSLTEIIVTAQKTSASAQRTPAAVSVLLGQDLVANGITDVKAAEVLLPSSKLAVENSAVEAFVRGVGSSIDLTWVAESVAINLDGIYLPRFAATSAFFDTQRIEVLPGPQGTLYGRSAVGGAINVVTNKPAHETSSDVVLEYGNYSTKHATLVENVSISPAWSVRGALDYLDNSGYNNNGTYSTDAIAARLSSLYESGDFSGLITGSFSENRVRPSPTQYVPYPNGNAYNFPTHDNFTAFIYPPNGIDLGDAHGKYENSFLSGQLDWNLGPVTLSYIPGAVRSISNDNRSVAAYLFPVQLSVEEFSNELRVSRSASSDLNFVGGLYQLWNKSYVASVFGPNFSGGNINTRADSYAAYGQGTYSLTDRARLTVGARLSRDDLATRDADLFYPILPTFSRGSIPFGFSDNWKRVGWKVGGEFDVTPTSLLYGTVQTGFNPGTFTGTLPNPSTAVEPQSMIGYTAGLKNQFWDGRIRLNLEGFLYNYKDLIIQTDNFQTGVTSLLNAPRVRITGAQLDFAVAPVKELKLSANVGYLDAQIREFSAGISAATLVNYAGYQLPYSPPYTASLNGEYTLKLGDTGSLGLRASSYMSSAYWAIFSHTSNLRQDGFAKTDVSLTYYAPHSKWDIALYGNNLENVATIASVGETGRHYPFAGVAYVERPRLYGVRFHFKVGGSSD